MMFGPDGELGSFPCTCLTKPLDVKRLMELAEQLELIADHISVLWREAGYLRLAAAQLRRKGNERRN